MQTRTIVALGLGLALLCLGASVRAQHGAGFTPEERRALREGELVRRPQTRREGGHSYIGGTSWIRVDAPRDRVFEEVTDVSAYPRLIPGVSEARLVEGHGDRRLVFFRHRYSFVSASYYAFVRIDRDAHTVHFDLDPSRPHDVRAGRGFISVDRHGRTRSIVTWGVMVDAGSSIVSGVFGPVIHDWILRVPWCVRGRVVPAQPGC